MAVVIPIVWIGFLVLLAWVIKSKSVLSGIRIPMSSNNQVTNLPGSYELGAVSDA